VLYLDPMKTIFITGANKGIGIETASQLLSKGHRVILGGRSVPKLQDALQDMPSDEMSRAFIQEIDVTDQDSILAAAESCRSRFVTIDVLINNAAVLLSEDQALTQDSDRVLTTTFTTNVFGPVRMVKAFLPIMNSPGRIINVSSSGGMLSSPAGGWSPAYCASKTALNGITHQLALELKPLKILVNSMDPGWVRTDMGGSAAPRSVAQGAETQVWLAAEADQSITGGFFRDKDSIPW